MSEHYLANENFPLGVALSLRGRGDDVLHAGETLTGEPDHVILQTALAQDRILLTFDMTSANWFFGTDIRRPRALYYFACITCPPT